MDWDWYLVAMGSNVLGVGSNTDRVDLDSVRV